MKKVLKKPSSKSKRKVAAPIQNKPNGKLKKLDGWVLNKTETEISKTFKFKNYIDGLAHIARIAVFAEVFHHHPEIEFSRTKVKIRLSTHEAKGLTNADFEMAAKIESVFKC